jgi:hypothetical protein
MPRLDNLAAATKETSVLRMNGAALIQRMHAVFKALQVDVTLDQKSAPWSFGLSADAMV